MTGINIYDNIKYSLDYPKNEVFAVAYIKRELERKVIEYNKEKVRKEEERYQELKREKELKELELVKLREKQEKAVASERRSQVGSGDRSEKIRTYNYPQGRITDHRIGFSIFQMEDFLNGNMDEMIDNLIATDRAEKLKGDN